MVRVSSPCPARPAVTPTRQGDNGRATLAPGATRTQASRPDDSQPCHTHSQHCLRAEHSLSSSSASSSWTIPPCHSHATLGGCACLEPGRGRGVGKSRQTDPVPPAWLSSLQHSKSCQSKAGEFVTLLDLQVPFSFPLFCIDLHCQVSAITAQFRAASAFHQESSGHLPKIRPS